MKIYDEKTLGEMFSRQLEASLEGCLRYNFIREGETLPKGFVRASVPPRVWFNTCWTRDAGCFLRELAHLNRIDEACAVANYLLGHVEPNPEGYCLFPEFFRGNESGYGREMDGTAYIVNGLAALILRLPPEGRGRYLDFVFGPASPVFYVLETLERQPLIAGTGEFGGGWCVEGDYYNLIQNALIVAMLQNVALLCRQIGDGGERFQAAAEALLESVLDRFVFDGRLVFAVSVQMGRPRSERVFEAEETASINGFLPALAEDESLRFVRQKRVRKLAEDTLRYNLGCCRNRATLFEKYGIMTFVKRDDSQAQAYVGHTSWLAYCNAYLTETTFLLNLPDFMEKSLRFMILSTASAGQLSPAGLVPESENLYFYERNFSPDWRGERPEGCGALNLVHMAECLKTARLLLRAGELDDCATSARNFAIKLPFRS